MSKPCENCQCSKRNNEAEHKHLLEDMERVPGNGMSNMTSSTWKDEQSSRLFLCYALKVAKGELRINELSVMFSDLYYYAVSDYLQQTANKESEADHA